MEAAARQLLEEARSQPVTLVPASLLDDWEGFRDRLAQAGAKVISLAAHPSEAQELIRKDPLQAVGEVTVLDGLSAWDDPSAQVQFLGELRELAEAAEQRFIVAIGPDIVGPDILPPLRLSDFSLFDLPPSPLNELWIEMGAPFSSPPTVMEMLHADTGGSKPLALEILTHAGSPATLQAVSKSLRALRGEDGESLLGRILTFLHERPESVYAVYCKSTEAELTDLDKFRLLAVGIVRRKERELAYASPLIQRFVEDFFTADSLADLYQKRNEPRREQFYLNHFLETPQFVGLRPAHRGEIYFRLADLADKNGDELGFYLYSRQYLKHVGLADSCAYLEGIFVPRAVRIVQSKGYPEYRAALDLFIEGLAIITGQPSLLLYTRDPANNDTLTCHVWRSAREQPKVPDLSLNDLSSPVVRLITGLDEKIDMEDVFKVEWLNKDFARQRGLRSLVVWPLVSDGRRFGAIVLENPYAQAHPLATPVRMIARRFLKETEIAIERAGLVASEVELLSKFHLLLEAARTDKPSDLVHLAQRIIHASIREIRVSAVRLFEGHEQRRMRLVSVYPDDEELRQLREHFTVISPETSALEAEPRKIAGPLYKPDLSTLPADSPTRRLMEARNLRWVMVYDLAEEGGRRLGRLTFYGRDEWSPQKQEFELLEGVKQQIALALRNINETESNARRQLLLTELYRGLAALAEKPPQPETLKEILHTVLKACCEAFGADVAHCLLLRGESRSWAQLAEIRVGEEEEDCYLELLASGGVLAPTISEKLTHIAVGEGMSGYAVAEALKNHALDLHVCPDASRDEHFIEYVPGIQSAIAIVLRRRMGQVLGVFTIESQEIDHFDDRAIDLARDVARELASAIEFVDLFDALSRQALVEEMGLVSADLAHWLGNVLPLARNRTERALKAIQEPDPQRLQIAAEGLVEAKRLLELAIQMREELQQPFLHNQPWELVDLVEVLHEAVAALPEREVNSQIQIRVAEEALPVWGLRNALMRLVHALLRNAQDAVDREQAPRIEVHVHVDADRGKELYFHVRDNGPGADPSRFREYMRPFKSTKSPTQGTGLGLWTVQKVVDAHKGRIKFVTAPGEGMTVQVWLPIGHGLENP